MIVKMDKKVGIYTNKIKDLGGIWSGKLERLLRDAGYTVIGVEENCRPADIEVLFVLGGDGTILGQTEYAAANGIPIIGINAGKLGFLTEFETFEMEAAVSGYRKGILKADRRMILNVEYGEESRCVLNDAVIQRFYVEGENSLVVNVEAVIDGILVDKINGDGVIVSTPTGSTAYSLSAGGAILAPGINALSLTPISAHSLHHRPIIYSADSEIILKVLSGGRAALYTDGKLFKVLSEKDKVRITKSDREVVFLRKKDSNFYNRLLHKLNANG